MVNALIKTEQKESEKHHKYISAVINALIKSDKKKLKFYKHLNGYLEAEIELEGVCNE